MLSVITSGYHMRVFESAPSRGGKLVILEQENREALMSYLCPVLELEYLIPARNTSGSLARGVGTRAPPSMSRGAALLTEACLAIHCFMFDLCFISRPLLLLPQSPA